MNDRRREAEQRLAARRVLEQQRAEEQAKRSRYIKAVFRGRVGEVVRSHDGRKYQVQDDGSLRRVEGGMP